MKSCTYTDLIYLCVDRYDKEGHALDGQSMTELRGGGSGGGPSNWKTLADVKNEHLGHGDKVNALLIQHAQKLEHQFILFTEEVNILVTTEYMQAKFYAHEGHPEFFI